MLDLVFVPTIKTGHSETSLIVRVGRGALSRDPLHVPKYGSEWWREAGLSRGGAGIWEGRAGWGGVFFYGTVLERGVTSLFLASVREGERETHTHG